MATEKHHSRTRSATADGAGVARALRTLSRCNRAITRARDEASLLREVCELFVDAAGYRFAWIGYVRRDAARTIEPMARAGVEDGYLDNIRVTWGDDAHGQGPAGSAVRTRRPFVVRDTEVDAAFAPWQAAALARGYRAVVGLPLVAEDEVLGMVAVYAAEPNVFDDDEVALLYELASDLAFGLRVLRERAAHARAEAERRKLSSAIEQSADVVLITDAQGLIEYVNPAFERVTGYTREEVIGRNPRILASGQHDRAFYDRMWGTITAGQPFHDLFTDRRKSGGLFQMEGTITPLRDDRGVVSSYVYTGKDITERREAEERLHYLTNYDLITGLPNRWQLNDRLRRTLERAADADTRVMVAIVDLDRFQYVNEGFGHQGGDALLKQVAERLTAGVEGLDVLARFGADEFAVVAGGLRGLDEVSRLAETLSRCFDAPFTVGGQEIYQGASLGIAVGPDDGGRPERLLSRADAALRRAKRGGGARFRFFETDLNRRSGDYLTLVKELRRALARRELVIHYQLQVDVGNGRVAGVEALLRWHHPERGLVPPGEFIHVLEETGLIMEAGAWLVDEVCRQVRAWQHQGVGSLRVAVNLSPRQVQEPGTVDMIATALSRHELDARWLEVEVTESAIMDDERGAHATLQGLRDLGVRIALDDFGTGYSSLSYIRRFPVDALKIDKSFVDDVTTSPDDAAIARTIISMAESLHMDVVAEGVEREAQMRYLRGHGCRLMQGYLFSRPVPPASLAGLLERGCGTEAETNVIGIGPGVLLVDDEPNILNALKRVLRREGYRVFTAGGAEEALEALACHDIGVIVSDQRMPGMTGTELFGRVKELYPCTVRIILSGHSDLKAVTEAINRGAVYKYLMKPWEDETLRRCVREAFAWRERQWGGRDEAAWRA